MTAAVSISCFLVACVKRFDHRLESNATSDTLVLASLRNTRYWSAYNGVRVIKMYTLADFGFARQREGGGGGGKNQVKK